MFGAVSNKDDFGMPREFFTAERHQRPHQPAPTSPNTRNWDVEMMQVLRTLSRLEDKVEKLSSALPEASSVQQPLPTSNAEHDCLEKSRVTLAGMYAAPEDKRLDSAADELVAVIHATEAATEEILSACETIDTIAHNIAAMNTEPMVVTTDDMAHIQECIIRIYQAATFQDITGQRITKVSRILADIEVRINSLADTLGVASLHLLQAAQTTEKSAYAMDEQHLLNGPARNGEGISQSDIDAMFNDF